jgi:hypothetical protein
MERPSDDAILDVLACEWQKRPRDAPTFADLAPALRGLRRGDGELVADYDARAADPLAEVVAAEQLCCAGIDWRLDGARLIVRATPAQLDALEQLLPARG